MKVRDIMTSDLHSVRPDATVREIARLLLEKRISAIPVLDEDGAPVGMVSEGDLIGRGETDRESRRDWWLALVAEDAATVPDVASRLPAPERVARDVMSRPVITVNEDAGVTEVARLLAAYRIKRVPVLSSDRVVGIVSRADLLHVYATERPSHAAAPAEGFWSGAIANLDRHFLPLRPEEKAQAPKQEMPIDSAATASEFQTLVAHFEQKEASRREKTRKAFHEQREREVQELTDEHVSDESWHSLLQQAKQAAENGATEFMILRFPSQLCSDRGRAINNTDPTWPATLRGEAAEIYLRWQRDLKPHGLHLAARVLDFPGGVPGDIGLFLHWER